MRGDGRDYVINWIIDDGFVGLTLCRERSKKEKKEKKRKKKERKVGEYRDEDDGDVQSVNDNAPHFALSRLRF